MRELLPKVTIYTDGAAAPNPGPGGYGVVVIQGDDRKPLSGGFRRTTNNRMEILAESPSAQEQVSRPSKEQLGISCPPSISDLHGMRNYLDHR
jgi:ribonuclease HI